MTDSDRQRKFLEKFVSLARERLEALNDALLTLESEKTNDAVATEMMREIHTLKGESRLVRQVEITQLAHRTEDVLLRAREGSFASQELIALGFEGFDLLTALVENAAGAEFQVDIAGFHQRAEAAIEGRAESTEAEPARAEKTTPKPPPAETQTLERPSPAEESLQGPRSSTQPRVEVGPSSRSPGGRSTAPERTGGRDTSTHLRVDVEKLQSLTDAANGVIPQHRLLDVAVNDLSSIAEHWTRELDGLVADFAGGQANASERQLRALLSLVTERASGWRKLARRLQGDLARVSEQSFDLGVALRDVRDRVQRIRLLPLNRLFGQYPRAMRDLAQELGRRVHFHVEGSDVEVDKEMMDALHEPLLHILRNAIDHGIEEPAERIRRGKPEIGTVTLRAHSRGAEAEIVIEDDGGGIMVEAVRRLAILRGVTTPQLAATLTTEEVLEFIFMPGFSTRKETTELSGRGIGLNVVRERLAELRGSLAVASEEGKRTVFTLRVPVSSVVTRGLIVRAREVTYAIDPRDVLLVAEYDPAAFEETGAGRTVTIDDRHLPLFDLAALLGAAGDCEVTERTRIVAIEHLDEAIAVVVDDVLGEREVTQRAFDSFLAASPVAAGTAVVETGAISVLLHAAQLLELAGAPGAAEQAQTERSGSFNPEEGRGFSILVVDDSELMRGLLGTILSARGYRVNEAINGAEALSLLSVEKADLILADLDMPVMDGFEMIAKLRANERTQETPIIVLSARGGDADRQRAAELGADAFLAKTDFEEEGLCRMVATMLPR